MRAYISPGRQIDVGIWQEETIYFHGYVLVRNGSQLRDSTEYRCIVCECGGGEKDADHFIPAVPVDVIRSCIIFARGQKAGINLNFEWERVILYMEKGVGEGTLEKGIKMFAPCKRSKIVLLVFLAQLFY
ncbi:hypothetical protein CEXT_238371 [Caerostris extrusa]|uniref:Uncharacterized protein n=1 Tax=Caerostris extrusa TaxID=172846 RepID=A0AAV4T6J1_CAEEX|nr:hypothetical protein CEXT_238371 [Caerostris extrusa]